MTNGDSTPKAAVIAERLSGLSARVVDLEAWREDHEVVHDELTAEVSKMSGALRAIQWLLGLTFGAVVSFGLLILSKLIQ